MSQRGTGHKGSYPLHEQEWSTRHWGAADCRSLCSCGDGRDTGQKKDGSGRDGDNAQPAGWAFAWTGETSLRQVQSGTAMSCGAACKQARGARLGATASPRRGIGAARSSCRGLCGGTMCCGRVPAARAEDGAAGKNAGPVICARALPHSKGCGCGGTTVAQLRLMHLVTGATVTGHGQPSGHGQCVKAGGGRRGRRP